MNKSAGALKLVKGGAASPKQRAPRASSAKHPFPTPVRIQLAQKLRTLVTGGTYRPGDRMTERELCERLKVSRPSLREALRQLEAEGLLDVLPNRGPVVRMIDVTDVLELWEVRAALETLIARRFAATGTPEQVDQLEATIRNFGKALQRQEVSAIKSTKNEFFEAFAAGANNRILAEYFTQVSVRLSFLWSSSLMFPGRPEESIGGLLALLVAIRNRNADAAQAAIVLHNEHAKAIAMYGLRLFEETRARKGQRKVRPHGGETR